MHILDPVVLEIPTVGRELNDCVVVISMILGPIDVASNTICRCNAAAEH